MNDKHNDINKKLIDEYLNTPVERLATKNEIHNMQGNINREILSDLEFSPVEEKKKPIVKSDKSIQKYLIPFSQREIRQYDYNLDIAWNKMEKYNEQGNDIGTIKEIEFILQQYHDLLSLNDTIDIYFLLIHRRLEIPSEENKQGLDATIILLDHLLKYEPQMESQQKDDFRYYLGTALYCKAGLTENNAYYQGAVDAFDNILHAAHRENFHKHQRLGKILLLPDERYKEILFYKIHSLSHIGESEKILSIAKDFLDACGRNPAEKTYEFPQEKKWISDVLFLQGTAYEVLDMDNEAIECYRNYLALNPKDEYVMKNIEYLISKNSEE